MHRIDHPTKDTDLFGSGKHGFTEGTPGTVATTRVTDDWLNGVQEEIANTIEGAGIALVKGTRNQLLLATQILHKEISVPLTMWLPNQDSAGAPDWYYVANAANKWMSRVNSGYLIVPIIPVFGITVTLTLTVTIKPGAARASTNRMNAILYRHNATTGSNNLTGLTSAVYDDSTANRQDLVVSLATYDFDPTYEYFLRFRAGNTGSGASADEIDDAVIVYS